MEGVSAMTKNWYEFDVDNESLDECRDRRLRQCPILSPAELEVLRQCRMTIWDGNLVSKAARNSLVKKGLVTRFNGWQVITQEGMAVLDTLGEMKDDHWPKWIRMKSVRAFRCVYASCRAYHFKCPGCNREVSVSADTVTAVFSACCAEDEACQFLVDGRGL
jgi:hypothetical protein